MKRIGITYFHLKQKHLSILLIFLCFVFSSFSQIETANYASEKVYLHIDKTEYYAGEDIWFKAYLVNSSTHSLETLSKIVYVELISPNDSILSRKTIKLEDDGGHGDFKLSSKLETGAYIIRAYTNYMRNFDQAYFFRKRIFIKSLKSETSEINVETNSKPNVQFFPEGGYLVDNFLNKVGFKAIDSNGKGVDVKGSIIDSSGNKITNFESSHLGMGVFHFIPKNGLYYKAIIHFNKEELIYDLPRSKTNGALLKVVNKKEDYIIYLQSSLESELQNCTLLGFQRNGVIFNSNIESKGSQAIVRIPKSILKEGIVQFTLLENKKPILERLAFYETEKTAVQLNIKPSKKVFETRELVELEISLDTILKSNLSLAVTDMSTVKFNKYDLDIKSQLLLNSELKGTIEQPGYYFYSDHPKTKEHLDILMMTQRWRQFSWNEVLEGKEQIIKYPIEQGFSFKGKVKKYSNRNKVESVMVSLMIRNNNEFYLDKILSEENGYFEFGDYDLTDSTSVIIQAQKPSSKKVTSKKSLENLKTNYFIELDTFSPADVTNSINLIDTNYKKETNLYSIEHKNQLVKSNAAFDKENDRVKLDEVTLKADVGLKKYDSYVKNKQLYEEPTQRLDFAELGNLTTGNVLQNLDGRIAGLSTAYVSADSKGRTIEAVAAYFNRSQTSINGLNLPLYLLNGIPTDASAVILIPMSEVLFVDVLQGARATIYGPEAANGVIAVYTKDGTEDNKSVKNKKRRGIVTFIHPGYSQARKFYEPVYQKKKIEDETIDYRSTIYWNPNIKFDENGKAKVHFYTADLETTYRASLEGMTSEGHIIKTETVLKVEKLKTQNK